MGLSGQRDEMSNKVLNRYLFHFKKVLVLVPVSITSDTQPNADTDKVGGLVVD